MSNKNSKNNSEQNYSDKQNNCPSGQSKNQNTKNSPQQNKGDNSAKNSYSDSKK